MPTRMIIDGEPANIAISNKSQLKKALKAYNADNVTGMPANPTIEQLIDNIEDANDDPAKKAPGMTGYGGELGHAFLEAARKAITGGDNFDRQRRVELSLHGRIEDYQFNNADGSGRIVSVTYIDRTVIPAGNGTPTTRREAYKWEVTIEAGGFTVVPIGSNPNTDPFPGTLPFTPEMIQRVQSLGFIHKLWAKGTKIKIDKVYHNPNANNPNNWKLLDKSKAKFEKLYESTDDNCIDMMFVDYPPDRLNGMGPPMYCLGRCGNPMLVNTGM